MSSYLLVRLCYFVPFDTKYLSPNIVLHSLSVQTALLPFLLPAERRLRALYLPYEPPRDVCASAPTGSGKTLAYVIPIVEVNTAQLFRFRVHLLTYISYIEDTVIPDIDSPSCTDCSSHEGFGAAGPGDV